MTRRDEERKNLIEELVAQVDEVEDFKTRVRGKAEDLEEEGLSSGETVKSHAALKQPAPNQDLVFNFVATREHGHGRFHSHSPPPPPPLLPTLLPHHHHSVSDPVNGYVPRGSTGAYSDCD
uniref:Uncharacterized protein n=1 Tax=Ananas comosus var. bracteatus TaxID=296719 RepID=A0A6V7P8A8_ANACO|nr:unnamed protein product [Ananas comosus var. bracteatus]